VTNVGDFGDQAACLQREWETSQRWTGIQRDYSAKDVIRLRGSITEDHPAARRGARRLWELLGREEAVRALGAITGDQAVDMVQAGLQAIHLSGGQVSAVRQINNAMLRADPWAAPIVADAPAGFGHELDAFELMKAMIEAGAAGVHFEDRLSSQAGYGLPGRSVLIPTGEHIKTLNAARLVADVLNVPTLVIARTYAHETSLLTSDADERDHEFLTGERTAEGLHLVQPGPYARVTRALAFASYADVLWLETPAPNLAEARAFADIIYSQYPGKLLAYSCSPAFDWAQLDDASIAQFQDGLVALGYRLQFMTASIRRPEAVKPDTETAPAAGSKEQAHFAESAA
jgi:isocitrate lyase